MWRQARSPSASRIAEGTALARARSSSFTIKTDDLGDPLVSERNIPRFGWATHQDLDDYGALAVRSVN